MSLRRCLLFAVALALAGCMQPMTPADLSRNQVHAYPGHTQVEVYKAAITALRTLGYEIVVSDAASHRIKTAPKLVTVTAYGTGTSAVASGNSIAWTIEVRAEGDGTKVHAEPRGYSAGQAVPTERFDAGFLERSFTTLYDEIQDNLPDAKTFGDVNATEPQKQPAPVSPPARKKNKPLVSI